MSKPKEWNECSECEREMQRCREVTQGVWVCRKCWKKLDYDKYMYEHRQETVQEVS